MLQDNNTTPAAPPPPPVSASKLLRLKDLEAAVKMRDIEMEQLAQRKAELLQQGGGGEHKSSQSSSSVIVSPVDTLPVMRLANAKGADFACVAPERVGDVVVNFQIATASLKHNSSILEKTIAELKTQTHHQQAEHGRLEEQIQLMKELTGLTTGKTAKERYGTRVPVSRYADPSIGGDDREAGNVSVENPIASPRRAALNAQQKISQLRARIQGIAKEMRAADLIKTKNAKAIKELTDEIKKKKTRMDEVHQFQNDIRVVDRSIREREIELKQLMEAHEVLDGKIDEERLATQPRGSVILDRDVAILKQNVSDVVEKERRVQDRVLKAQELRIKQLESRLATIQQAINDHKLSGTIDAVMAEKMMDARVAAASRPASTRVSGSGGAQEQQEEGTSSTPTATTTGSELALAVPMDRDTLYNIDAVIPQHETVHPAIYSLFNSQKEIRQKAVTLQSIMLEEKRNVIEALESKVTDLTHGYDVAVEGLELLTAETNVEMNDLTEEITETLRHNRDRINELRLKKLELRRRIQARETREKKKREKEAALVVSAEADHDDGNQHQTAPPSVPARTTTPPSEEKEVAETRDEKEEVANDATTTTTANNDVQPATSDEETNNDNKKKEEGEEEEAPVEDTTAASTEQENSSPSAATAEPSSNANNNNGEDDDDGVKQQPPPSSSSTGEVEENKEEEEENKEDVTTTTTEPAPKTTTDDDHAVTSTTPPETETPESSHNNDDNNNTTAEPTEEEKEKEEEEEKPSSPLQVAEEKEKTNNTTSSSSFVIFLDIDGVLLPVSPMCFGGGDIDETCVSSFKKIYDCAVSSAATTTSGGGGGGDVDVRIILSSTWRHDQDKIDRLNKAFADGGLGERCVVRGGVPDGVANPTMDVTYLKKDPSEQKLVRDRCDEIEAWFENHNSQIAGGDDDDEEEIAWRKEVKESGRWIAIDDMKLDHDDRLKGHFVFPDVEEGLRGCDVQAGTDLIQTLSSSSSS